VIGPTYIAYWPLAGAVGVTVTLAKERQHPY
jgi:hypothetical protein